MRRPTILALDLEGTLISNAYSQIPRPGLHDFLVACTELAPRIVMFTTVPEPRFRGVADRLVEGGVAPAWFRTIEYVDWSGPKKDLAAISGAGPIDVRIVDDDPERFAVPAQRVSWIPIPCFDHPYDEGDAGFNVVFPVLERHFR